MQSERILTIFAILNLIVLVYLAVHSGIIFYVEGNKNELNNYADIRDSFNKGNNLKLVMNYHLMNFYINNTKLPSPDEKSGFDISQYQFFGRGSVGNPLEYLITSFNVFVYHPKYKAIYDYGKLRLYENDFFILESYFLNPLDFSIYELKTLNGTLSSKAITFYQQTPKFLRST